MATIRDYRDAFGDDHVFVVQEEGPRIEIACQPMGGSAGPDVEYADNGFFYELRVDGDVMQEGNDLRSGGMPRSARQIAVMYAAGFTDSTGFLESWVLKSGRDDLKDFARNNWMALGSWALDNGGDEL